MTTLYSANYTKAYVNTSNDLVPQGELGGKVKTMFDTYALDGSNVLALNDEIYLQKLPPSARIVQAIISSPTMGGTGKFSMGYKATLDEDGVALAEDADAIIDEADAGAGAVTQLSTGSANLTGFLRKFGNQETQLFVKVTEASTAVAGTIKFVVHYIVD